MDINITLIIQMLVFLVFVWFTMKFVWPPLSKAMEERQEKIADGLAAAERGRKELELAQHKAKDILKQGKQDAAEIIEKANRRASAIIEEAKHAAEEEARKKLKLGEEQLVHAVSKAKLSLQQRVADLAIAGAERILGREVDKAANEAILNQLIEEI